MQNFEGMRKKAFFVCIRLGLIITTDYLSNTNRTNMAQSLASSATNHGGTTTSTRSTIQRFNCAPFAMDTLEAHAPWLGVALVSISAVYLGYFFVLCKKEAAVSFNVPLPPEVRANWPGRNWEDVQGDERRVLEGQAKGVSPVQSSPVSLFR